MRVITRHSKLLYFRKHLPAWQFAALDAMVRVEARLRGALGRARGRADEARSWRAVGRVAKLLGAGADLRGRAVRILAEAVEEPPRTARSPGAGSPRPPGTPRDRRTGGRRERGRSSLERTDPDETLHAHRPSRPADGRRRRLPRLDGRERRDPLRRRPPLHRPGQANSTPATPSHGLFRSIDHPAYPLAIAGDASAHRRRRPRSTGRSPRRWPRSSRGSCWSSRSTWSPSRCSAARRPGWRWSSRSWSR